MVETTGVYYEELAYFLADNQQALSVLLPNKAKHFAQSTEQKSKTDLLDARLLCRLGLERVLPACQPPSYAPRQPRPYPLGKQLAQVCISHAQASHRRSLRATPTTYSPALA